jgi:ATP cone domain/Restriction endonuclease
VLQEITVIKASGATVPFSTQKLRKSLRRSGADERVIEEVAKEIEGHLQEGMTTKKIYQLAFRLLRKKQTLAASKYKLKKAIMELGPSGYPFEKYVSEIFKAQGHSVQINLIMKGRCVNHEVDVLAEKDHVQKVMECKYHNFQGTICDVKIPLYVHSRFKDIREVMPENKKQEGWVVTNTRFSGDAIQYGICAGLNLLGWDFPEGKGLREIIGQGGLYPITCLTTLTQKDKVNLMSAGIVLCREISINRKALSKIGIPSQRVEAVLKEASDLVGNM